MEEMFSDKALMSPDNFGLPPDYHSLMMSSGVGGVIPFRDTTRLPVFGSDQLMSAAASEAASFTPPEIHDASSTAIKAKIAAHPRYPRLLQAYIDCHKVGAPPEMARILDEIRRESDVCRREVVDNHNHNACLGMDPELDEFMETYCEILDKYKSDLARPFDEATNFLNEIETQLRNLCKGAFVRTATATATAAASEEGAVSSDEEDSGGEVDVQDLQQRDEDRDLKDQLLRRFGSHISSLKLEFSKKKKKGKLPREARQLLFDWWNAHYKWPYPTEADKIALAEATGLDQRQINNWFINQRKRHWKPSENMQFALMDNLSAQYFIDD